ncbi:MAG: sodium:calcium symporter [Pedosphaera sp.]|nr:sodium:calcium symporter [Pedosphaera sp.]
MAASFLMIWRLESMAKGGLEGTVLGTLVMPYCSGIGNLIFAFVLGRKGGAATEVLTNCLVNNVTNMTLVLGIPAIIWGMNIIPEKKNGGGKTGKAAKAGKAKKSGHAFQVNRLSLLLTLLAVLFFTGATWALGQDGKIGFTDGLVLVGLFLFWQCFQVFDVLKTNAQQNKSFSWMLLVDLGLLAVGAYAVYLSTDWLVAWISKIHTGFISVNHMGWLSGWLMVLPNAMLAVYYGWTKRPEIVYTSQVGDGHICIPLCIGVFALFKSIQTPAFFITGIIILLGATLLHFIFIAFFGRLPRFMGWVLITAYIYFLCQGLGK